MDLANRFMRNKDLIPQDKLNELTIVGLGGIGSAVAINSAIMGWDRITGYDGDNLETHNLSSTLYPLEYIGFSKAHVATAMISEYGGKSSLIQANWNIGDPIGDKVLLCVDDMEIRLDIYKEWLKSDTREILIDMRMDALSMEIISCTKENDFFGEYWVSGASIADAPCTMKHTIFTSSIVAGWGLNNLFCMLTGKPWYGYIWHGLVPFQMKTEHLVTNGYLKNVTIESRVNV